MLEIDQSSYAKAHGKTGTLKSPVKRRKRKRSLALGDVFVLDHYFLKSTNPCLFESVLFVKKQLMSQ